MKIKKILFSLVILFSLLFSPISLSYAQTPPGKVPVQPSQTWKCLKGPSQALNGSVDGGPLVGWAHLSASGFPSETVYVVTCIEDAEGFDCTTTNKNYDKILFGKDFTDRIGGGVSIYGEDPKDPSQANNLEDPKIYSPNGVLKAWASIGLDKLDAFLSFYGVAISEPKPTSAPGEVTGDDKSQQQGTFELTNVESPDDTANDCVSISWSYRPDPYGIIFDSQSLEPLPSINVAILDSNKKNVFLPGLTNPQKTKKNGLFNFLVEPGTYYLTVNHPNAYSFTASPKLHPNYTKIYHKVDGTSSIYKPNEPIIEKAGKPEHRDIPLDPGTSPPFRSDPSSLSYGVVKLGTNTKIEGKLSHPFTKVTFTQGAKIVNQTQADRFGFYECLLDNSTIAPDLPLSVTFTKIDLTSPTLDPNKLISCTSPQVTPTTLNTTVDKVLTTIINLLSPVVLAQSSLTIQPIFSSLEGYAYDEKGYVAPNAEVNVNLQMTGVSYYQTKADDQGYFMVDPGYLPIFPYYLEFIPQGTTTHVAYTTSEFARKNKPYLTKKNINLMNPPKTNVSLSPTSSQSKKISPQVKNILNNQNLKPGQPTPFLLIIILVFLFILTVIFIIAFIKKSNRPPENTSSLSS